MARIGSRIVADVQKRMYAHLLKMDVSFFQQFPSSDLIARIAYNANASRQMLNTLALGMGRDLLTIIGLVVVMISQDPIMSLVCLVVGPIAAIGLKQLVKKAQDVAQSEVLSVATIVELLRETTQGIRIVKSFQLEGVLQEKMNAGVEAIERLSLKIVRVQASVNPLIETLGGLAVAGVVVYAGWRNLSYNETPGQFFSFITALLLAADPARRLSRLQLQLASAAVGVRMMYDLLDRPAAEAQDLSLPDLRVTEGELRLQNVTFGYDPASPVLKDITLVAPAGRMTALVGLSGSGKSTIFNIMQRFWTPSDGEILIDGQSIAAVSLASLRSQVALVSQDVFMFDGTIIDNIRAGRRDASDGAVIAAAQAAYADKFITELPRAYDAKVGELGSHVSGGQRQRLALARAFLKDAPIILLDEPTSALDSETEQFVQEALKSLTRGRTTIVIAHRLATVMKADLIHVIDSGRVVESGTHRELIKRDGLYSRLYQMQFSDTESMEQATG